jgi:hypothetical protein
MCSVFAPTFSVVPEMASMTVVQMKPTLGAGDHVAACVTHLQPTLRRAREQSRAKGNSDYLSHHWEYY